MRRPTTMRSLEDLGRTRLSRNFFLREFLHSEIASLYGIPNIPDDPDLAIAAGTRLCEELLEPLWDRFGRISIRSAFRSAAVNDYGNTHNLNCSRNEKNFAGHIWDRRDANGRMGATASIVVHAVLPYYERTGHWEAIAWWVHDHLPYADMEFFPKLCAFNIQWKEGPPSRRIYSFIPPRRGLLTKPGMPNHEGSHESEYRDWLASL